MDITSVALGGLQSAETRLNRAAVRISRVGDPNSADSVNLSQQAIELIGARESYESNLKTLRVGDEITKSTLDMLA